MPSTVILRTLARAGVAGLSVAALSSCASELTRTGSSPVYVIVDSIEAASGADPERFGTPLLSDVQTLVETTINGQTVRVPTFFNDLARAQFRIALKNPGTGAIPTQPSPLNQVTINRYRVTFRRADGRNTPGVDVPHPFDGAFTITIPTETPVLGAFELVRHQAKLEPPLANLAGGGGAIIISTLAEITFYGRDQAGNDIEATATLSVNFGDFADPRGGGNGS
jgi:hypothetical protein